METNLSFKIKRFAVLAFIFIDRRLWAAFRRVRSWPFFFRLPFLPLRLLWLIVRRCIVIVLRDPGWIWITGLSVFLFYYVHNPTFANTVPTTSISSVEDWHEHWQQLPDDKNAGGVLWQVENSFEINDDFKITPESYWQVGEGHTLDWKNTLLNEISERSQLYKLGAGRLSIHSAGVFNGMVHLLEGSLLVGQIDGLFGAVNETGVYVYPGTRLEYDAGALMRGDLHLKEQRPASCGRLDCTVATPQGPYADGLQWVVNEGVAIQQGGVVSDLPIYKLGSGVLHLSGGFVGPLMRGDFHVLEGGLWLNAATGAPIHIHQGGWVQAFQADLARLFVRPGGRLQVGRHNGGPGLKIGLNLLLEAGAITELSRGADAPENPVIQARPGADIHLDGHLLIGLKGNGWDPNQRYALILADSYAGEFAHYQIEGELPADHIGVLRYDERGLWLGFEPGQVGGQPGIPAIPLQPQPAIAMPYAAHRHSLILNSYYFPQSVWQFYQQRGVEQPGLSGWVWAGGTRQRALHGYEHSRLNGLMNYFGLNWQSSHDEPINIAVQFGLERGNWYAHADKTQINGWLGGLSLQQKLSNGWHWQLGLARHQYRLEGHRGLHYQHHYRPRLTQLYGQMGYLLQQDLANHRSWSLNPTLSLRWLRLKSPEHQEQYLHMTRGLNIQKTTDILTEFALGLRGEWSYQPPHQSTTFYTEIKHHWWKGHTRLRTVYFTNNQKLPRYSSSSSKLKPYYSWQLGLYHQPHKNWTVQAGMHVRLGQGLRDNALNLQIQGVF